MTEDRVLKREQDLLTAYLASRAPQGEAWRRAGDWWAWALTQTPRLFPAAAFDGEVGPTLEWRRGQVQLLLEFDSAETSTHWSALDNESKQWAAGTILWNQPSIEGVHVDELAPWLKRVEAPVR